MQKSRPIVKTPYGVYQIVRKDAVAITVIRVKRKVRYHRTNWEPGAIIHMEHNKIPRYLHRVKSKCSLWADPIRSYTIEGDPIELV